MRLVLELRDERACAVQRGLIPCEARCDIGHADDCQIRFMGLVNIHSAVCAIAADTLSSFAGLTGARYF